MAIHTYLIDIVDLREKYQLYLQTCVMFSPPTDATTVDNGVSGKVAEDERGEAGAPARPRPGTQSHDANGERLFAHQ